MKREVSRPGLKKTSSLTYHEKAAAFLLAAFFIFLLYSHIHFAEKISSSGFVATLLVEVDVKGAVKDPGTYQVEKGSTLGALLSSLELDPEADTPLEGMELKIERPKTIYVKKRPPKKRKK